MHKRTTLRIEELSDNQIVELNLNPSLVHSNLALFLTDTNA